METPVLPEGVTLDKLLHLYERNKRQMAKRADFFATEEGKEYNKAKARAYYEKNKAMVLQKMKVRREANPETEVKNARALEYYYKNRERILENNKRRRAEKSLKPEE